MKLTGTFALLATLACVAASPFSNMIVHDSREAAPAGFKSNGPAPAGQTLKLKIALRSTDIAGLERETMAVSDPASARYGAHLSDAQVKAFVQPTADTVSKVNAWLSSHGLTSKPVSNDGEWIEVSVPVNKANVLLGAQYETFSVSGSKTNIVRTLSYSIPADLATHINAIHPTTTFDPSSGGLPVVSMPLKEKRAVPSSCASTITPACLQALYGIPTTKATQSSNQLAVSGFIDQFAQTADLKSFLSQFRTDIPNTTTFKLQEIDGGQNTQNPNDAGIEANLDIQYTVGVATGVPVVFISVGDNFQDGDLEGFLDIINFISGESQRPQVLTTSYGQNENTISRSLASQLCNAYTALGAKGTSILFASGDGGVAGSQSSSCSTFLPTFPSGCPFMTSVGATTGISPETAASFSSGGFSNYFGIPSYQSSQVAAYKKALGSTNSGKFNTTGRGFPDVSAQGENVEIVSGGQTGTVDGTSCSSPIFASVISLLNDRLIAAGKSPLGFLNPFLYSSTGTAALNDVTSGSNPGCNTNGFPAKAGWDPVTGLGTPNFAKLLTAVGL